MMGTPHPMWGNAVGRNITDWSIGRFITLGTVEPGAGVGGTCLKGN